MKRQRSPKLPKPKVTMHVMTPELMCMALDGCTDKALRMFDEYQIARLQVSVNALRMRVEDRVYIMENSNEIQ